MKEYDIFMDSIVINNKQILIIIDYLENLIYISRIFLN